MIDIELSKVCSLLRDKEVSQAEGDGVRTTSDSQ
jgi:hypothetical protein